MITSMGEPFFAENPDEKTTFWNDATKYTDASKDESFVEEIAYMLITVHRTGA